MHVDRELADLPVLLAVMLLAALSGPLWEPLLMPLLPPLLSPFTRSGAERRVSFDMAMPPRIARLHPLYTHGSVQYTTVASRAPTR